MIPTFALAAAMAASPVAAAPANSGTLWVGPQAVSVSLAVSGPTGGRPHPCVVNNGPHVITVTGYLLTDPSHILRASNRDVAVGAAYCWIKGAVTLPAHVFVSALDKSTGATGSTRVYVSAKAPARHRAAPLTPLRPTAITTRIQEAVGVTPDGAWGQNTEGAVNRLRAAAYMHYGVRRAAVAALQGALGVTADGDWGPITDDAWLQARNAAYYRY